MGPAESESRASERASADPLSELETVRTLARLARLALTAEEERRLAPDLQRILAAFEVLARHAAVAAPVPPSGAARTRGDEPQPSMPRAELLAAASATADGFFSVPKTVGGER
jgi:aspartyl/glutamyl-tRNA(Asn/Gln) amidotransferase C subunit